MGPLTITVTSAEAERRLALRLHVAARKLAEIGEADRAVVAMTESARLTHDLRDVALVHGEFVWLDVPCLVCGEYVNPNRPCPLCAAAEADAAAEAEAEAERRRNAPPSNLIFQQPIEQRDVRFEKAVVLVNRLAMSYARAEYRELRGRGIDPGTARLAAIGWATSQFGSTTKTLDRDF